MQNLVINKNSIQITSTLFLEELKQAEKRTKKLANLSEEQKIDHFWNVFFKDVENKVREIEEEKIRFENKKSYYDELSKKFRNSIERIHEKNVKNKYNQNISNNDMENFFDSLREVGIISRKDSTELVEFLRHKTKKVKSKIKIQQTQKRLEHNDGND